MKHALVKNGVVDTIAEHPVLKSVETPAGWIFLYEMVETHQVLYQDIVTRNADTGEETAQSLQHVVITRVPKVDDVGQPIGILDPAWLPVGDDVFPGFVQRGDEFGPPAPELGK